jgi:chemosensory pili system protein ChpA (sensor histidine kinase/response regulator)
MTSGVSQGERPASAGHDPIGDVAAQSLELVTRELATTLGEAQRALEDHVQGRGRIESLQQCRSLLHLARGALRIIEVHGASLLAEEMEHVCDHVMSEAGQRNREESLEALSRAMVQLPVYLERVMAGGRDIALVLLPLLNDLRAVRGRPLLSEGTLLLLNPAPDRRGQPAGNLAPRPPPTEDLVTVARRVRPAFQLALLGLIKGQDHTRNLERLARAAGQLEEAAGSDPVHQLWWVVGGVLEALLDDGLEASVTVKRLLGQADRQIKRLIADGEAAVAAKPPLDLLNNLLYYVARARSVGQRIEAIRSSFALSELLPGDDEVAEARESLSGPSIRLMHTVAAAIKEDLARVKDVLDIHVRTGSEDVSALAPQLDMLKKIADTLGVLGLGELRGDIQSEIRQLGAIVRGGDAPSEATLLSIAATLLQVEDGIDQQLVRMASPSSGARAPSPQEDSGEQRAVAAAVLRECAVNLARVKEAISAALADSGPAALMDEVPVLLRGINAALLMLGHERAVRVVENIDRVIRQRLRPGRSELDAEQADRLADAVVSLEYYMETLAVGRSEPWYMLDNAESCLSRLVPERPLRPVATAPEPVPEAQRPAQRPAEGVIQVVAAAGEARPDPELLEVFIEEAKEEVASLGRSFPAWRDQPADTEALVAVRRSFHTLKGSGRMVGAQLIGEFCWSVENLLNRIINGTLERGEEMLSFLAEAIGTLPQLVEQLELGIRPRADVRALMKQAEAFASGDPAAAVLAREMAQGAPIESSAPVEPAAAEEGSAGEGAERMDPVLRDIFLKETAGHLQVVSRFLDEAAAAAAPPKPTEDLYRACHTLLGSARMAGVAAGEALAGPMEHYVRGLMGAGAAVTASGASALALAAAQIERLASQLAAAAPVDVEVEAVAAAFVEPQAELAAAEAEAEATDSGLWQALSLPADELEEEAPSTPEAVESRLASEAPDPELAAIFSEEAAEILEQADEILGRWSPGDMAGVVELQRLLHTLKGGARMAGLAGMGDLAHEIESLLEGLAAGRVEPAPALSGLLQRCTDALHGMRDAVDAGLAPVADPDLLRAVAAAADELPADEPPVEEPPVEEPPVEEPPVEEPPVEEPPVAGDEIAASITGLTALLRELEEPPPPAPAPPVADDDTPGDVAEVDEVDESPGFEEIVLSGEFLVPEEPGLPEDYISPDEALPEQYAPPDASALPEEFGEPAAEIPPEAPPPVERADVDEPVSEPVTEAEPGPPRARPAVPERQEFARVDAELLDDMLNSAGEISIFHSRLNRQVSSIEFHLGELSQTATRMREQLRALEAETERQIRHRHHDEPGGADGFDPLELDRYSTLQQLSRALAESVSDVASLNDLLRTLTTDSDTLLVQQGRVTLQLQDGLMRTRMVPFQRHVSRLARLVRQTASRPASVPSSWSRGPAANSIGRCSSACCPRWSTCCAMR